MTGTEVVTIVSTEAGPQRAVQRAMSTVARIVIAVGSVFLLTAIPAVEPVELALPVRFARAAAHGY